MMVLLYRYGMDSERFWRLDKFLRRAVMDTFAQLRILSKNLSMWCDGADVAGMDVLMTSETGELSSAERVVQKVNDWITNARDRDAAVFCCVPCENFVRLLLIFSKNFISPVRT